MVAIGPGAGKDANQAMRNWSLLALVLAGVTLTEGQVSGPFEIPDRLQSNQFRQRFLADCSLPLPGTGIGTIDLGKHPRTIEAAGMVVEVGAESQILVSGKDRADHGWAIELENGPMGCRVFGADLDYNGRQDFIIITQDASSGPDNVTVTLLLLDRAGRPIPWHATAAFTVTEAGLGNLVDLDRDGRAELLFPYVEDYYRGEARGTSVFRYSLIAASVQRVDGMFAGNRFPIVLPRGTLLEQEPDLSTRLEENGGALRIQKTLPGNPGSCGLGGQLRLEKRVEPGETTSGSRIETDCEDRLVLSDGRTIGYPSMLIVDQAQGRSIVIVASQKALMAEVIAKRLLIKVVGRAYQSGPRPFLVWASNVPAIRP